MTESDLRENPTYCGDAVYAYFDGFGIELRANDHLVPSDRIFLEPSVLVALIRFAKQAGMNLEGV